ncbi:MAG: hypothetical protein AAGA66_08635 [Bacteroidota bacterium]
MRLSHDTLDALEKLTKTLKESNKSRIVAVSVQLMNLLADKYMDLDHKSITVEKDGKKHVINFVS